MKIINFAEQNSIINKYMAEMRDKDYQTKHGQLHHQKYAYIDKYQLYQKRTATISVLYFVNNTHRRIVLFSTHRLSHHRATSKTTKKPPIALPKT